MEQYNNIQQLLKKEAGQKDRLPVFPPTVIQAVFDGKTGANLEAILAQFNNIHVQYQGSPKDTRNIIPEEMRRPGLIISYMDMDSKTITEKANSAAQKDNDHWGLDTNWSRVDELTLSGDISVSASGTWIINGQDTRIKAVGPKGDAGLTPWLKTIDNHLHFSYDGITWEPCSEPIAAWFRWSDNKIQISRDNKTWTDLTGKFADNLFIKGYKPTISELPSGAAQGDIYGVGPTYAAEDTGHKNPIYRYYVRNAGAWVDNGSFTSISAGVVQETGDSETEVMSQKAVTTKLTELGSEVDFILGNEEVIEQTLSEGTYPQINISRDYAIGDDVLFEVITPNNLKIVALYEMSADGESIVTQHSINSISGRMKISDNYQGKIRVVFDALSAPTKVSVKVTNEGALRILENNVEELELKIGTLEPKVDFILGNEDIIEQTLSAAEYPQINISRNYKAGDVIRVEVLAPTDLKIGHLYEMSADGNDVVVQHFINATSGTMEISENYQGRIRILFAALSASTKVSVRITNEGALKTLENKVDSILGHEELLEQTLPTSDYPQINISRNYKEGDIVIAEVISPSDLKIAFLYEMSADGKNVITQHQIYATSGKMEISDSYQGKIRILFFALSSSTKVSVRLYHNSRIEEVELKIETLQTEVETLENKVEHSMQQIPRMNSLRIIKRVGCIGDSYTQGHIQLGGQAAELKKDYSWPFYLSQITGNTYSNWGVGGSTAKDWINSLISVVDEPQNKCQAYIIGLGINDSSDWSPTATQPGDSTDIGTDNDVYIAYYYKIVQKCLSVNPLAKVFCQTMPNRGNNYNAAIRSVVDYCNYNGQNNVILVDLAQDRYANSKDFYKNPYFLADFSEGHYTAIGYEFMAECLYVILSDVIFNNISEFQNIHQIPYDEIL